MVAQLELEQCPVAADGVVERREQPGARRPRPAELALDLRGDRRRPRVAPERLRLVEDLERRLWLARGGERASAGGDEPRRRSGSAAPRSLSALAHSPAATAGAVSAASSAAAVSTATAPASPAVALRSTWGARTSERRATAAELRGEGCVQREPARGGDAVVDRAAHERVPEGEAASGLAGAHEVGADEGVERRPAALGSTPAAAAATSSSKGSPATAAPASSSRAPSSRSATSWWIAAAIVGGRSALPRATARPSSRRKSGLPPASRARRSASARSGSAPRTASDASGLERAKLEVLAVLARRGDQLQRRRAGARAQHEGGRRARRAAQEVQEPLEGPLVRPLQVVDGEQAGAPAGDVVEQRPQGPVVAEPLGRRVRRSAAGGR